MRLMFTRIVPVVLVLTMAYTLMAAGVTASATGSGHFSINGHLRTFSFSAVKDSSNNVTGQAQLDNRDQGAIDHLSINCLNVVGHTAIMSGVVTSSTINGLPGYPVGTPIWFKVVDNGEGSKAPADQITLVFLGGVPTCNVDLGAPLTSIDGGNVQVH